MGRPSKISQRISEYISLRTLQDSTLTNSSLVEEVEQKFGISLSDCTIRRERLKHGFVFGPPLHSQLLTQKQIDKRIAFCRKILDEQSDIIPIIVFSNESRFVLGSDKRWVWKRRGDQMPSSTVQQQKFPSSVMVFAVIGVNFKSKLLIVEGSIDSDRYIQNLEELNFYDELDKIHGTFNWVFMQDGARCHTCQKTLDYIEENCDIIPDWPPNSPDLNPIELLWGILKAFIQKKKPQSKQGLVQELEFAWNSISMDTINKLCESFESRLKLCLKFGGQSISSHLHLCKEIENFEFDQAHVIWTREDDEILMKMRTQIGNKWNEIAKNIPHKKAHQCKTRWYTSLRYRQLEFIHNELNKI